MSDGRQVLRLLAEASRTLHPTLTHFDQVSGDGDFGDNFRDALLRIEQQLDQQPDAEPFQVASNVFLDEVGGSSGPLLGLLFQAIARSAVNNTGLYAAIGNGVPQGTAAIQRVGEAAVGDRTMIDALVPACEAMSSGWNATEVARVARRAALDTTHMQGRQGRSSYVGERALGVPDPGAVAVSLLFWAVAITLDPNSANHSPEAFLGQTGRS